MIAKLSIINIVINQLYSFYLKKKLIQIIHYIIRFLKKLYL